MRARSVGWLSLILSVLVLAWGGPDASAAETRFTVVNSSGSSWVARGYHNYTVSASNGWTITASRNFDNGVGFNISGPALPGTSVGDWDLNFAAPGDALITPGSYPNLQRFPFQDSNRPGLEFGSTGRLDNQAGGFFDVYEATYAANGDVLSFSANFTHYGEANPNNWAVAEIRYNTSVPEPQALAAVALAVVVMARGGRRRRG